MGMHETSNGSLSQDLGQIPLHGSRKPDDHSEVEAELARYMSHLGKMSEQLKQTSAQIEEAVVGVCNSFQGIATRARATVARASDFLGHNGQSSTGKQSFEGLIEACSGTLVKIMNTTAEAGDISHRAIERIQEMVGCDCQRQTHAGL